MKMPWGKYRDIDVAFINSGYLGWLMKQDWFIEKDSDLVLAVEKELDWRDSSGGHFYQDKVQVKTKRQP